MRKFGGILGRRRRRLTRSMIRINREVSFDGGIRIEVSRILLLLTSHEEKLSPICLERERILEVANLGSPKNGWIMMK